MNFSKYGFDGLSQCFPQFKMVSIFLGYFFPEHLSIDASEYLQYLNKKKTTKMKRMSTTDEHNQIAKKLIFYTPYQPFNVKMLLEITNMCYQQHRSIFTNVLG